MHRILYQEITTQQALEEGFHDAMMPCPWHGSWRTPDRVLPSDGSSPVLPALRTSHDQLFAQCVTTLRARVGIAMAIIAGSQIVLWGYRTDTKLEVSLPRRNIKLGEALVSHQTGTEYREVKYV
jgi:hypothetical protein